MQTFKSLGLLGTAVVSLACGGAPSPEDESTGAISVSKSELRALARFSNENGIAETLNVNGAIDTSSANPFFRSMGQNGRSCGTCHVPKENWSITPAGVRQRFDDTDGLDPIFRTNDGSNSPVADVSTTEARRAAYSMLLTKGLIRVGIGIPANAEFELVAVNDPYGYASAAELSLFRRPLPSTNLDFLTATMWDGRESTPIANALTGPNNTHDDLATQANSATVGHAEGSSALPQEVRDEIVRFELGLFTAQSIGRMAGPLDEGDAQGGVSALSTQENYFGINDVVAGDPTTGAPFDPLAMTVFDAWSSAEGARSEARRAIARGQALFNTKPIAISGVRGVNDALGVDPLQGTCTTCHDAPNVGNHSVRLPLDLGLTDASRRTSDMPLYTLCKRQVEKKNRSPIPGTCDRNVPRIQTTDPGVALITGKWAHVATFKGPILRGLSGRGPYFHNGSAATLADVVEFYDQRFVMGLTAQEKADLTAFLGAL
jgi:cytochrome c peroxidase